MPGAKDEAFREFVAVLRECIDAGIVGVNVAGLDLNFWTQRRRLVIKIICKAETAVGLGLDVDSDWLDATIATHQRAIDKLRAAKARHGVPRGAKG
jgi:hypothetical protein